MPNHVRNVWRVKGIPQDKIEYVLNKLSMVYESSHDDGSEPVNNRIIDFDLIIPEPRFIKDCPKEFRVNKNSHVQEVEGRPWFNWYDWHVAKWGTKWNAYDGYTKIGKTQVTFVFSTAWSFPYEVAMELEKLGYDLDLRYADEAIGSNCGRLTYHPDTGWTHYDESELSNPAQFARDLWNRY